MNWVPLDCTTVTSDWLVSNNFSVNGVWGSTSNIHPSRIKMERWWRWETHQTPPYDETWKDNLGPMNCHHWIMINMKIKKRERIRPVGAELFESRSRRSAKASNSDQSSWGVSFRPCFTVMKSEMIAPPHISRSSGFFFFFFCPHARRGRGEPPSSTYI